tara:strand:- start:453 stop:791 length:339 start_codon:yes stop_codon:yes gene_type:complete
MVRVEVTTGGDLPMRIRSTGHAQRPAAADSAACAAVSVVLKSFGLALARNGVCRIRLTADRPGVFDLEIEACDEPEWVRGMWAMARISLEEIEAAWPRDVQLTISEEKHNGT